MQNLIRNSNLHKKRLCKIIWRVFCILLFFLSWSLNAQTSTNNNTHNASELETLLETYTIEYSINWQTFTLTSKIHANISDDLTVTESLYSQQSTAYKEIEKKLPSILSAIVNTFPLSSQNSLSQFMKQYNMYKDVLHNVYIHTSRIHHALDKNFFGLTLLYTSKLTPFLVDSLFPQFSHISIPQEASLHGILRDSHFNTHTIYTHLIFSVEKLLPIIREKKSEKKLFSATFMPRVVAEDGRIVYTPEYFEDLPQSVDAENSLAVRTAVKLPFQYLYEENTKEAAFISSALIIIPIATNSEPHSDIVISNRDANMILGSEVLREIIRSGRVVFIISSTDKNFTTVSKQKKE